MAGKRTMKAAKNKPNKNTGSAKKAAPKKAAPKKAAPAKKAAPSPKKAAPKAPPPKAAKPAAKAAPAKAGQPKAGQPQAKAAKPSPPAKQASGKATPQLAKSLTRPAMPPPRPTSPVAPPAVPQKRPQGELLTLVPARSSSSGLRPRQEPVVAATSGRARAKAPAAGPKREGVTLLKRTSERPSQTPAANIPIPVRKVEAPPTLEERAARIEKRLEALDEATRKQYFFLFDQAWVSHDSALEGTVYMREELEAGFSSDPILTDSSLQPAADEIRRHREAIEFVRDFGQKKKLPVTIDTIKKIFLILHPSEGDLKTVRYRKDIPQHRLYFHEYAAPDKIQYKVRQIVDWANAPDTKKSRSTLRLAARVHYDLLRVFPFQTDSGKVARLFMNLLLYRGGYPPAIIHAKERQSYYEALKGEPNKILRIVQDSVEDGLGSIEKLLDEQDAKKRGSFSA